VKNVGAPLKHEEDLNVQAAQQRGVNQDRLPTSEEEAKEDLNQEDENQARAGGRSVSEAILKAGEQVAPGRCGAIVVAKKITLPRTVHVWRCALAAARRIISGRSVPAPAARSSSVSVTIAVTKATLLLTAPSGSRQSVGAEKERARALAKGEALLAVAEVAGAGGTHLPPRQSKGPALLNR
jgi:hypothetical protein